MWAEDVGHYWKTSRTSPDTWIAKAVKQIEACGGTVLGEAFGRDAGHAAFMLAFEINGDRFKIVWPVLPSKSGDERAAKIQAATMLYHDVKAKTVGAKVLGMRAAFFAYLVLPDGRTAAEAAVPELVDAFPKLLTGGD